jgi:hypothetical protein
MACISSIKQAKAMALKEIMDIIKQQQNGKLKENQSYLML